MGRKWDLETTTTRVTGEVEPNVVGIRRIKLSAKEEMAFLKEQEEPEGNRAGKKERGKESARKGEQKIGMGKKNTEVSRDVGKNLHSQE